MASKLSERGLIFNIVFYGQLDELETALDKMARYAYILHDMDEDDPHYTILACYPYQRTVSAVIKDFVSYSNVIVEVCRGFCGSFEYLTHSNDPNKYQYSKDRIKSNDINYFRARVKNNTHSLTKEDESEMFLDDLLLLARRVISLRTMAKKYGRDFMKNYLTYRDFAYELMREIEDNIYDRKEKNYKELINDESLC